MTEPVCDFCMGKPVLWRYPCKSSVFKVGESPVGINIGDWAACDPCQSLIERDDRNGLAGRTVASPSFGGTIVSRSVVKSMHEKHFFANRTGPAMPHVETVHKVWVN